ncbi:MAG: AAA family ATPase [Gemmatimonadales bacterium]|nr:AAA family ATPase [Gemmatimonadales bacterium]
MTGPNEAGTGGRATRTVVLTGPECAGKTTLARALAEAFAAPWTPEAARIVAEQSATPLSAETVAPIARLAMRLEDEALAAGPALLVRDTDLVSTLVYARHYYGTVAPWIVAKAKERLADLYLLCEPDLPWSADGVRDRPDRRLELHAEFARTLEAHGARIALIRGSGEARTLLSIAAVRAFLDRSATAPGR